MKVILDTNVLISGIFFGGTPARILKEWANQKFHLVLSQDILLEYQRVASELSSKFPGIDIKPILELITIYGKFVDTEKINIQVCEDPDDNKFLECAIAGKSKLIISGDKHLLKLTGYKGISILSPRSFIEKLSDPGGR